MKKNNKLSIIHIIWLFVFGCLLGFILETIWYYLKNHIWINKQGLLYGPLKPIYGFGFIIIVLIMRNFKEKNVIWKFVIGTIIGSSFEYFGSLFQEYIFGTSTWSYASFNYNISGRLYLPYCLAWGIIAIICIDFIYPYLMNLFSKVPPKITKVLTILMAIFLIIDISLTSLATIRYSERANNIERNSYVFKAIDNLYPDEYMKNKFPKLKVIEK